MLDLIQQNPIVSFLLFLIPIIGGTWKVFDILFVKPRDFRIAVLEKNVEEIRKELQRYPRDEDVSTSKTATIGTLLSDVNEVCQNKTIGTLVQDTTLLNSMTAFYESWKDKSLTDLQRDQFEKNYIGRKVVWSARLGEVSQEKNGLLWVSLTSEKEQDYGVHVIAVFESKYKETLLMVNKGQIVTVSGAIDSFSLSPLIKDCAIVRKT